MEASKTGGSRGGGRGEKDFKSFKKQRLSTGQPKRPAFRIMRAGASWVPPVPQRRPHGSEKGSGQSAAGTGRVSAAERAPARPRPEPQTCRRDSGGARRGGRRAGALVVRGGFLRSEVMDLAGASRPARKRGFGQEGGGGREADNVFLVRDSQARPGVLLLVPYYNIKMQLDSGQARPRRRPGRAAADSHGRQWAVPGAWALRPEQAARCGRQPGVPAVTRGPCGGRTPRRAPRGGSDSATPAPRPPALGRPGIVSQDLISCSS